MYMFVYKTKLSFLQKEDGDDIARIDIHRISKYLSIVNEFTSNTVCASTYKTDRYHQILSMTSKMIKGRVVSF